MAGYVQCGALYNVLFGIVRDGDEHGSAERAAYRIHRCWDVGVDHAVGNDRAKSQGLPGVFWFVFLVLICPFLFSSLVE